MSAGAGMSPGMGMGGSMGAGGMDGMDALMRRGNLDDMSALSSGGRSDATTASIKDMNRTVRLPGSRGLWGATDKDLPPITMVHKAQPLRRHPLAV